ncbi:VWA domain-containing protein [Streptomyces xanthochromogenes]|uniref:VWA domain-containing protein n=1 Tax=Streptomyces xanthochromogenes TaxID=67384 RepID=UPI003810D627
MSLFRKATTVPASSTSMVDLTKKAAISLQKQGLTDQRAAVYLVLDHSGSMHHFYADGSVQRLAEQALGLSANLDADGTVPIVYFGSQASEPFDVNLADYEGVIGRTHPAVRGSTNYVDAMETVVGHYKQSGATGPALVIFQTDGAPDDRRAVEEALRTYAHTPFFWAFVGFGNSIGFLERLDDLSGRAVDNASFFHARDPLAVGDEALYDGLTREYAAWLAAAKSAGIVR